MTTALTPTPTRAIRALTDNGRRLEAKLQNARNIWLAAMKRAEADYIARVRDAVEALAAEERAPASDQSVEVEQHTA
jgi:exonuclease VII large subunit